MNIDSERLRGPIEDLISDSRLDGFAKPQTLSVYCRGLRTICDSLVSGQGFEMAAYEELEDWKRQQFDVNSASLFGQHYQLTGTVTLFRPMPDRLVLATEKQEMKDLAQQLDPVAKATALYTAVDRQRTLMKDSAVAFMGNGYLASQNNLYEVLSFYNCLQQELLDRTQQAR